MLLEEYTANFILAIRLPPTNEFTEYIIPSQKAVNPWSARALLNNNNFNDSGFFNNDGNPTT